MESWRVTFRCNPYRAKSHFLWVNTPDNTSEQEVKRAAYGYKNGLPVDEIDEVKKWFYVVETPDLILTTPHNDKQN